MSVASPDAVARVHLPIRHLAAAAAAALIGNLVVLAVAGLAGADLTVRMPGGPATQVGVVAVSVSTLLAFVVGGIVTLLAARRSARAVRLLAWVGLAVAVLSLAAPLMADAEMGTRLALGTMHLVAGLVWWSALRRADA